MAKLLISFERQNLRLVSGDWLFRRGEKMRFEWIALLAFKRLTAPGDQAWVTLGEIARLPSWSGRRRHHVATNIGRYLQSAELDGCQLVEAANRWAGPYRMCADTVSISFDVSMFEVRKRLQLRSRSVLGITRGKILQFTLSYARAQWLFFQGRLIPRRLKNAPLDNAYVRLLGMADDRSYGPTLRLLACLSAVEVLYRLGRFKAARETLLQSTGLLHSCTDQALKAQFHLKLAWALQRGSSGSRSDRAVENALVRARSYAENSGDRAALGLLAHRTALYLTKKQSHLEAVTQLIVALEANLITGNYDLVQSACGNIGSVIHRLGQKHYREARQWLLSAIAIARWMKLGRDDAHAEMILGKIYVELGYRNRSQWLLARAERVAERAGNQVNLADVKMVWAFWYQRFGSRRQQIDTLTSALSIFHSLSEFDAVQKEKYIARRFPEVWDAVSSRVEVRQGTR